MSIEPHIEHDSMPPGAYARMASSPSQHYTGSTTGPVIDLGGFTRSMSEMMQSMHSKFERSLQQNQHFLQSAIVNGQQALQASFVVIGERPPPYPPPRVTDLCSKFQYASKVDPPRASSSSMQYPTHVNHKPTPVKFVPPAFYKSSTK